MSFSVLGQCPTIPDSSPPAICDASGFTFNDLNAYAVDGGDGIRWHKVATGGSPFNANQLVSEGTYYADNSSGSCITRESIIVDFQVNRSGQSLDGIYCSNENATIQTYMDEVLQPNVPIGGSVKVYTNNILTNLANPTDPIPVGATNYFIVFVDNGGCESQVEGGSTAVFTAPADPTPTNPQAYCSDTNPTVADLNPGTTGNYNWYENIDGSGDPVLPALDLTTSLVDGNTYYIQVNDFFCDSNPVAVNVSISVPFNPGASSSLEYCNDNISPAVFNLFDELGGLKDTNGTWTGPLATTNGHQGTVDISTLTTAGIYTFTYMVPSNGACPEASASVVITIYETLSSGSTSLTVNPATYCEKDLPTAFDLFNLLDGTEDLGGQWTDGSNSIVSNPIDLSGLAAGVTYNFTYTQNALPSPCPEQSTTVQVTVLPDPNAGIAIYQTFCENDLASNSPFDLFNALSGQDNNSGTWTDASNATVSNSVDITGFTVTGSPYQFTYTISKGTCEDMETISITIEPAPESGTPIATFPEFCEGSAPASYDLFDLLTGEDQTGTWYIGPDNTGSTTPNPIDLSVLAIGTYDFTFDVNNIGSCDDVLVTVSVTINLLPNTGIPLPTVFCENDLVANSPLNLLDRLSGEDAGGTWADDDTTGALSGNTIDLNILTIGAYDFTYSITDANGCSNSSTVTVQVDDAPESGTATAPLSFCISEITSAQTVDLFDLLTDEDQTGTWNDDDASGALSGNILTIDGLSANTYNFTYGVNTIGSCDDDLVTVQVIINPLPNTGTPLPTVFCENDLAANAPLDLFDRLSGEDAGGTWADDDTTGALSGNNVDLTLLTIGNYSFTYSITDANGCSNSSTVTVQVNNAPESGIAIEPLEFCLSEITVAQTVNLFDLLTDEDQAGIWNDNNASGALSGNTVTIDGLSAGTYNFTFDVNAIGSCDDVNVMVTIIINDTPAPIASAIQEFCDAATVADLSATGTTIKWYDDATGGAALESTITLADGETYYATQMDATTGCESSVRTAVTVNIYQSPNAGDPSSTPIVACNNSTIDLSLGLDGTQDSGGTWYEGSDNTGTLIIDPTIYDVTGLGANNYQFTYYVIASAPCVDDSTTITVTIQEPLSAGANINPTLDICSNNGTTDLFGLLGGADTGGTWSPALASTSGIFDPLVDVQGTYTYMLSNACGSVSNSVIVNVTQAPNAGTDNSVTICVIDGTTDLFALLGTAQTGGTWSPLLNSGTGVFDPLFDTAGVYIYTITATAPCNPDSTAEIIVTVSDSNPPTVLNLNPEYCLVDNPKVSDLNTSISATDTVTWYADAALTTTLNAADALIDGEDYYATQTNTSGCESSANVQINVTVNDTPTPSLDDASIEYCINDAPSIQTLSENLVEYVQADDNIVWYNAATGGSAISNSSALTSMTYYAALVDAVTGCESSIRLEITPNLTACGLVQLPDGFLPNGDGTNDTYDYDNLDVLYPKFEIEIYNRYGSMVYKGNASTPRFNGKSNQGRTLGSGDLPVGMYYYIFNYNDGVNNPKQGNLYLSR